MSATKAIIGGVFVGLTGAVLMVAGAAKGLPDLKELRENIKNVEKQTVTLDSTDYTFDFCAADVKFYKTTNDKSYIDYQIVKYCTVEATDSSFKITTKKHSWFYSMFGAYNVINVYIAEDEINSMKLTLDAGNLEFIDGLTIKSFEFEENAGNMDITNAKIKNLEFDVNAGNLTANILYPEAYYTISTEKNLGNLTVSPTDVKHQTGSEGGYILAGEVNAGNADITFSE